MVKTVDNGFNHRVGQLAKMPQPPRLYFDTNAITAIADDPNRDDVIRDISRKFRGRLGLLVVAEIGCIKDPNLRSRLLNTARLVSGGSKTRPFDDPRTLVRRHVESIVQGKVLDPFIDMRDGAKLVLWEVLENPGSITEGKSKLFFELKEHAENWFHKIMSQMRPRIQNLTDDKGRPLDAGHLSGFLKTFRRRETFLRDEIANIVATTPFANEMAGHELKLLSSHNLWPYFLAAMGAGCYNRAFRKESYSARKNAGGVDTWQTVYLAFADAFVTEDVPFRRLLKVVRRYAVQPHHPMIWSYGDLQRALTS